MEKVRIGVIGGSGLYQIEGLKNIRYVFVDTPFGEPSDEYIIGELEGEKIAFLPRHGRNHSILPYEINYRANIYGFKKLGVEFLISISAVGSMKEDIHPLDLVLVDQFFDFTKRRISTFFGDGIAAHISFANPVCPVLLDLVYKVALELKINVKKGGTYLCIEGPQFSTKAESKVFRSWGVDVIGMTNLPEAKLAREAEICYVSLAFVTDYDVWKDSDVNIEEVIVNLKKNVENAKNIIKKVIPQIPYERNCICSKALEMAILTSEEDIPEYRKKELLPIIGKYLKKGSKI